MVQANLDTILTRNVVNVVEPDYVIGETRVKTFPSIQDGVNLLPLGICLLTDFLDFVNIKGRRVDHFSDTLTLLEHINHIAKENFVVRLFLGIVRNRDVVFVAAIFFVLEKSISRERPTFRAELLRKPFQLTSSRGTESCKMKCSSCSNKSWAGSFWSRCIQCFGSIRRSFGRPGCCGKTCLDFSIGRLLAHAAF